MSAPCPLILDTDPGIDDAMAILMALADREAALVGLTTVFGNVAVGQATRNALGLLALAEADLPVAEGAARPLEQAPRPFAEAVHGADGLGGAPLPEPVAAPDPRPAEVFLAEETAARPGAVTIVALGPLTNLARALAHDPGVAKRVAGIVVMGGALETGGNVTPEAEANLWQDPHAAEIVLAAPWPVTLVGLDVTQQVHLYPKDLAPIAAASPRCGSFLARAARAYFDFHGRRHRIGSCHLHDPAALAAALDSEPFGIRKTAVAVTVDGAEAGRTVPVAGRRRPAVRACLEVDAAAVRSRVLGALASGRLP